MRREGDSGFSVGPVSAARDPEDSTGNSTLTPAQGRGGRAESLQAKVRDQEVCRQAGSSQSPFAFLEQRPASFLAGLRTSCHTLCLFPNRAGSWVQAPLWERPDLAR